MRGQVKDADPQFAGWEPMVMTANGHPPGTLTGGEAKRDPPPGDSPLECWAGDIGAGGRGDFTLLWEHEMGRRREWNPLSGSPVTLEFLQLVTGDAKVAVSWPEDRVHNAWHSLDTPQTWGLTMGGQGGDLILSQLIRQK